MASRSLLSFLKPNSLINHKWFNGRTAKRLQDSFGDRSGNASGPLHDLPDWAFAGLKKYYY
jgi:hypothetical protein